MTRALFVAIALFLCTSCRARDRIPVGDSPRSEGQPPTLGSGSNAARQASASPSDYAVYAAVLREYFLTPQRGEHGLHCEPEGQRERFDIVRTTQPLPPGNPRRDSGWAAALPAPAAPLMAALRALDRQPGRVLDKDSLAVGIPVHLVPESLATRALRLTAPAPATRPDLGAAPLFWFSRVAYSSDRNWALVHAVAVCPGSTEAIAAEAESGAYETTLVAPLQWRDGVWTHHSPLFLDVGLPRLHAR